MEDKDADSYNKYFTATDRIIGTLFTGCAYQINNQNLDYHSKFIIKSELPTKGKMKFKNDSECVAIKLALKEQSRNFYIWEQASHLYWNTHNINEDYPFQFYPFEQYLETKIEYKGWEAGNKYCL